jgi:peptidoglycan/LPS O-acetylase OafA/YrhL
MLRRRERVPVAATGLRPEIELLRAVAVAGVVVAHLWPARLPGGYAGVDVFFVVSGFLISRHLLRELGETGRVELAVFWARRVRRLLPAAFLVLGVVFIATMTVLPTAMRSVTLMQLVASVFYVQNWTLAIGSVDYFAAEETATAVQHFWSLSVEEQFYLAWPLLLLLFVGIGRLRRRGLFVAILVVAAASFAWGVVASYGPEPSAAYFSTLTRVWEFCAGGLLALAGSAFPGFARIAGRDGVRRLLGAVGIAAIAVAFLILDPATPYPGFAALLPVAGALFVIAGSAPRASVSLGPIARLRVVRFVGGLSYSIYLWHWPLLVFAPFVLAPVGGLSTIGRVGIVVLTVLLAWATRVFVEDRFRRPRGSSSATAPARAFLLPMAGGAAALVCVLAAQLLVIQPAEAAAESRRRALAVSGCFGAEAVLSGCADPFATIVDEPAAATVDRALACSRATVTAPPSGSSASCDYPVPGERGTVAVIGDSHAGMLADVVADWAGASGHRVRLYETPACPSFGAVAALPFPNEVRATSAASPSSWAECVAAGERIAAEVGGDRGVRLVVVVNSTRSLLDEVDSDRSAISRRSVSDAIERMQRSGKQVVVIRDVPGLEFGESAPLCLTLHRDDPGECSVARSVALPAADPMVTGATASGAPIVDLSDLFCDARRCYPSVGGVVAYWDRAHLTGTMRDSLADTLARRLTAAAPDLGGVDSSRETEVNPRPG